MTESAIVVTGAATTRRVVAGNTLPLGCEARRGQVNDERAG